MAAVAQRIRRTRLKYDHKRTRKLLGEMSNLDLTPKTHVVNESAQERQRALSLFESPGAYLAKEWRNRLIWRL